MGADGSWITEFAYTVTRTTKLVGKDALTVKRDNERSKMSSKLRRFTARRLRAAVTSWTVITRRVVVVIDGHLATQQDVHAAATSKDVVIYGRPM